MGHGNSELRAEGKKSFVASRQLTNAPAAWHAWCDDPTHRSLVPISMVFRMLAAGFDGCGVRRS